jgi:hypothetical protein
MVKKNFVDVVNILLQQHGYSNSKLNLSQDFSFGCKDIKEKKGFNKKLLLEFCWIGGL